MDILIGLGVPFVWWLAVFLETPTPKDDSTTLERKFRAQVD